MFVGKFHLYTVESFCVHDGYFLHTNLCGCSMGAQLDTQNGTELGNSYQRHATVLSATPLGLRSAQRGAL